MTSSSTSKSGTESEGTAKNNIPVHEDQIEILFVDASNELVPSSHLSLFENSIEEFTVSAISIDTALSSGSTSVNTVIYNSNRDLDCKETFLSALRDQYPSSSLIALVSPNIKTGVAQSTADEHLIRPVTESELSETVTLLLRRQSYHRLVQSHLNIASKLATLETDSSIEELERDGQYTTFSEELDCVETQIDGLVTDFDDSDFTRLFMGLDK
ncbi:HalX domain-containing protein [Halomarina litorea]|uniref:HalX domain-containing protein n=1 Tax=Halomarina litorea TaxID=2961595 RepID=UPI0020C25709|nr:HalX domain-containing protein [Halomarina sp. BCD28]